MDYLKKAYNYLKKPRVYKTLVVVGVGASVIASKLLSPKQVAITAFFTALASGKIATITDYGDSITFK
jgi:heme O synthase-like polyprenyltransferase